MSFRKVAKSLTDNIDTIIAQLGLPEHTIALCGAGKAIKVARAHYRALRAGMPSTLSHINGLPADKYPEMSKIPDINNSYTKAYNASLDFIAERMSAEGR